MSSNSLNEYLVNNNHFTNIDYINEYSEEKKLEQERLRRIEETKKQLNSQVKIMQGKIENPEKKISEKQKELEKKLTDEQQTRIEVSIDSKFF